MPSTWAFTVRCTPVIPSPATKVTSAVASSWVGGVSLPASSFESAMQKQAACAAAISSSGVVFPPDSSARAFQLTSKVPSPEVSRVVRPEPLKRSPFQVALALFTMGVGIGSNLPSNPGARSFLHTRCRPP